MRISRVLAVVLAAAMPAAALSGCGPEESRKAQHTVLVTTTTTPGGVQGGTEPHLQVVPADIDSLTPPPSSSAPPPDEQHPAPPSTLADAMARLAPLLPAGSGVAVAPVGRPEEVQHVGQWEIGVSWSTIKVPLSIAALRADLSSSPNVEAALTASDNTAADALWNTVGAGESAAGAVQAVLTEGGDADTVVPSVQLRAPYSVFGQTQWSLTQQTRFAAGLPCIPDAQPVIDAMGRVIGSQQWGLGTIQGARFKGGWGPQDSGVGYLVRQFGLIPSPEGDLAVALAVNAGSFPDGTQTLNNIAADVARELSGVPGGQC